MYPPPELETGQSGNRATHFQLPKSYPCHLSPVPVKTQWHPPAIRSEGPVQLYRDPPNTDVLSESARHRVLDSHQAKKQLVYRTVARD